ncbi:acylneuraminate cytidylyltransferase [Escherichia coli]|uniref:Acylneuraminate cytidylyltransferase n=1 Tax=Escherichia coli TaxID=562 RepID=A0A376LBN8_ECOLX|nr:acylneuraminate cytidylyltransferase [Escherichia coli]
MPVYKEEKCCIKNLFIVGSSCFWRIDRDNRIINDLNSYLRENVDFAKFISLDHVLKDSYGNLNKMYTYDGLHFNSNGYTVLENEIAEIVK